MRDVSRPAIRVRVSEGRAQSGRRPVTAVSGTRLGAPNGKCIGYNTWLLGAGSAKLDPAPPCYALTCRPLSSCSEVSHFVQGRCLPGGSPLTAFIAHRRAYALNGEKKRRTRGKVSQARQRTPAMAVRLCE